MRIQGRVAARADASRCRSIQGYPISRCGSTNCHLPVVNEGRGRKLLERGTSARCAICPGELLTSGADDRRFVRAQRHLFGHRVVTPSTEGPC